MENDETTQAVIGCAYRVFNRMGYGFLESVYEKCLLIELRKTGIRAEAQVPLRVHYDGELVGEFVADLLIDSRLLVELKSVRALTAAHEVQLVNYLTATGKAVGLLINFGPTGVEVKRKYRQPIVAEEQAAYAVTQPAVATEPIM